MLNDLSRMASRPEKRWWNQRIGITCWLIDSCNLADLTRPQSEGMIGVVCDEGTAFRSSIPSMPHQIRDMSRFGGHTRRS